MCTCVYLPVDYYELIRYEVLRARPRNQHRQRYAAQNTRTKPMKKRGGTFKTRQNH